MSTDPMSRIVPKAISGAISVQEKGSSQTRLAGLDILRFVAVTLVVLRHSALQGDSWCSPILIFLKRGGWFGVDIFFVLSGFLVSGLLFREQQKEGCVRLFRFLIRRGCKIYPGLWFMVAISVVLWQMGVWQGSKKGLVGELLFLQNYLGHFWFTTWSLAVEEHFYLLLALITFLLIRHGRNQSAGVVASFRWLPLIYVGLAVTCQCSRIFRWKCVGGNFIYPSDCRIDELMLGVVLSYWWHFSPSGQFREGVRQWRWALLGLGVVCSLPAYLWELEVTPQVLVFGQIPLSFGAGSLVLSMLAFSGFEQVCLFRWLGKLGSYSYSAYLWHGPLVVLVITPLRSAYSECWRDWMEVIFSFTCTWVVGMIAAKLVELPALRLRDRLVPVQLPQLAEKQGSKNTGF